MIWEIISGFLGGATVINGIAAILVYRQYLKLASESMEFAAPGSDVYPGAGGRVGYD